MFENLHHKRQKGKSEGALHRKGSFSRSSKRGLTSLGNVEANFFGVPLAETKFLCIVYHRIPRI